MQCECLFAGVATASARLALRGRRLVRSDDVWILHSTTRKFLRSRHCTRDISIQYVLLHDHSNMSITALPFVIPRLFSILRMFSSPCAVSPLIRRVPVPPYNCDYRIERAGTCVRQLYSDVIGLCARQHSAIANSQRHSSLAMDKAAQQLSRCTAF